MRHSLRQPVTRTLLSSVLTLALGAPVCTAAGAVVGEAYLPDGHMLKLNFYNIEPAPARVTFRFVAAGTPRLVCDIAWEAPVAPGVAASVTTDDCLERDLDFQGKRVTGVVSATFDRDAIEVPLFFEDPLAIEVPLFLESMELFGPDGGSGRDRIWGTNGTSIVSFVTNRNDPNQRMRVARARGASAGQLVFLAPVTTKEGTDYSVTVSNMVNGRAVLTAADVYDGTGALMGSTRTPILCGKFVECSAGQLKSSYLLGAATEKTVTASPGSQTIAVGVATVMFDDPIVGFDDPIVGFDDPIVGFDDPIVGISSIVSGASCLGPAGGDRFSTTVAVKGANGTPPATGVLTPLP